LTKEINIRDENTNIPILLHSTVYYKERSVFLQLEILLM